MSDFAVSVSVPVPTSVSTSGESLRHDWTRSEVLAYYQLPFADLLYQAQIVHRRHFDPNLLQVSTLLSIKTGGCPEDCGYCSQSAHHDTGLVREQLLKLDDVVTAAEQAKAAGASRFCMGAAWRSPRQTDLLPVLEMIRRVKALGMETCVTLGQLTVSQAQQLRDAGLDYYNHNLDTSPEFYGHVITTRTYQDRLDTLAHARSAGLKLCAGGIIGLGERREDRAGLLLALANLPEHPESVPINLLVHIEGTPLAQVAPPDPLELVRTVAIARLLMPRSMVRLSAGRETMSDELQALCFLAGANSVFYGDRLLTTDNARPNRDQDLFARLGLYTIEKPVDLQPHGCWEIH